VADQVREYVIGQPARGSAPAARMGRRSAIHWALSMNTSARARLLARRVREPMPSVERAPARDGPRGHSQRGPSVTVPAYPRLRRKPALGAAGGSALSARRRATDDPLRQPAPHTFGRFPRSLHPVRGGSPPSSMSATPINCRSPARWQATERPPRSRSAGASSAQMSCRYRQRGWK